MAYLYLFLHFLNTWHLVSILLIQIPFAQMICRTLSKKCLKAVFSFNKKNFFNTILRANQLPSKQFSCASKVNSTFYSWIGSLQWCHRCFLSKSSTSKQPSCVPMSSSGPGKMSGVKRLDNFRTNHQGTQTGTPVNIEETLKSSQRWSEYKQNNNNQKLQHWPQSFPRPLAHLIFDLGSLQSF